jgi:hypothetical protein
MIRGTCYVGGELEDLYYLSTAGEWYRYDEEHDRLLPHHEGEPINARLAPDELRDLPRPKNGSSVAPRSEEEAHQRRVKALIGDVDPGRYVLVQVPIFHAKVRA